jgi:DNA-binding transcriptional regulator LsrR (DeoR family)
MATLIASDLYGRLIGLTIQDLQHMETVIALVSEGNKTTSILGALRTGIVDILIVDARNARGVLSLADAYPE